MSALDKAKTCLVCCLILLIPLFFSACEKSTEPDETLSLCLSETEWLAPDSGGTSALILVTSSDSTTVINWSINIDSSWLSVEPDSGVTPGSFAITIDSNMSGEERAAAVSVIADELQDSIKILDVAQPTMRGVFNIGSYDTPEEAMSVYVSDGFAYVADAYSGLQIIDVSNPTNPLLIGNFDTPGYASHVFVSGNYAFIADGYSGLQIIDISDKSNPMLAGYYDTQGYTRAIFISDTIAYAADEEQGLQIINIANHSHPSLIASYNASMAIDIIVRDHHAYLAIMFHGLLIIDISNPSEPFLSGSINDYGCLDLFVHGEYASIVGFNSGMNLIDIANPSNPLRISQYITMTFANSIFVSGKYAYISEFGEYPALLILDISDPYTPAFKDIIELPGAPWEVYVFDDYIFVATYYGLHIMKFIP
jgi:hypothetical protein